MNKYELVYFWIDNYKNLKELGIKLSAKHDICCVYDNTTSVLAFQKLNFIKEKYSPFDEHNVNITTIIGENGSGKSNLLRTIGEITQKTFDKKNPEVKYCIVFYNGSKYLYRNSNNIKVMFPNNTALLWDKNIKDDFRCLRFNPFYNSMDFPVITKNNYHNKEAIIQDSIRTYFYYDRLDEDITAFMLGRTINTLKKSKLLADNPNLQFNEFRWEIDIKRAYDGIVHNFKNNFPDYRKDHGITSYTNFSFPRSCSNLTQQFYTYIDRIVPFKNQKSTWKDIIKDIFPDVIFFGCVLEFLTYLEKIEELITDEFNKKADNRLLKESLDYQQKFHNEREQAIQICITEILKFVMQDMDNNKPMSSVDFIQKIIDAINMGNWRYEQFFDNKKLNSNYIKDFNQYYYLLSKPQEHQNIFNDYFELKNSTLYFKEKYNISIAHFLKRNIYKSKNANDFSAIEIPKYSHLNNKAVDSLIHLFPEPFLKIFFKINFLKNTSGEYYTYNEMSTGEKRILRLFTDIAYCTQYIRNLYVMDEVDMTWHPEWQRKMVSYLIDILNIINRNDTLINIIIATHSPIVLSDMPLDNVLFLKNADKKAIIRDTQMPLTFGTNIHTLYMTPFSLVNGAIGEFSQQYIRAVAAYLSGNQSCIMKSEKRVKDLHEAENIINLLNDDVSKRFLIKALEMKKMGNK